MRMLGTVTTCKGLRMTKKSIHKVCHHPTQRTVIFDDKHEVWKNDLDRAHGQLAFVRAYPYTFLDDRRRDLLRFLARPGEVEAPRDRDVHLRHAARLFRLLHRDVVGPRQLSTKVALHEAWMRTLKGLRILILEGRTGTGVVKAAQAFGAKVDQWLDRALHLVVVQQQAQADARLSEAQRLGLPCVHVSWLSFCFATFTLQDPKPFYLGEDCRDFWEAPVRWFKAVGRSSAYPTNADEVLRRLERESQERMAPTQATGAPEKTDAAATLEQVPGQDDIDCEPSSNEETNETTPVQPTPVVHPQEPQPQTKLASRCFRRAELRNKDVGVIDLG